MAGVWREAGGRVVLAVLVGLLVLLGAAYVAVAVWGGDTLPRNASVEGADVGGLTPTAAVAELDDSLEAGEQPLTVTYGDGRDVEVDPTEAGLVLDAEASVERAARGAQFSPTRVWALVTGGGDVEAVIDVDHEALDETMDGLEEGLGRPVKEGTVAFRDGEAVAVYGEAGRGIVRDETQALLERLLVGGGSAKLPIEPMQPTISDEAVDTALAEFGEPAMSGPVRLAMADSRIRVNPPALSQALSMEPEDGVLVPDVDGEALVAALGKRAEKLGAAPVDASFRVRPNNRVRVVESKPGSEVDPAELQAALPEVLLGTTPQERTLEVEGREAEADLTTEAARELGVRRRVSTFTTNFPYAEYRNVNIGQAADLVDGTLLLPGETFSMNDIVGERTAENGFTEGYVISDGIFRTELGGGVSQMATTLFNAAFFAGLEDVEHKPHSVYIDRYPEGREATVAWPTLDLKFRNNTEHGVLVKASVAPAAPGTEGAATVSMYSTKIWDVKSRTGDRFAFTSPSTRYITEADCESASGTSGFSVNVFRDFREPGEDEVARTEKFSTVYIPGDSVVCGPDPATLPPPDPEPDPDQGGTTGGGGGDNAGGGGNGGGGNGGGGNGNGNGGGGGGGNGGGNGNGGGGGGGGNGGGGGRGNGGGG